MDKNKKIENKLEKLNSTLKYKIENPLVEGKYITFNYNGFSKRMLIGTFISDKFTGRKLNCKRQLKRELTEAEAIIEIKQSLPKNIKYLGFIDNKWIGSRNTKIKLICKDCGREFSRSYQSILKGNIQCPKCRIPKDTAIEKAKEILAKKNLIFKGLVGDWKGTRDTEVLIYCKKHDFTYKIKFNWILYTTGCPVCKSEKVSLTNQEKLKRINDKIIKIKNSTGVDIEFLGYEKEDKDLRKTLLILKCNKHNITWNTTNLSHFINQGIICCPECSKYRSAKELEVKSYIDKIKPGIFLNNKKLEIYDNLIGKTRIIIPDFISRDEKMIIEYNGQQHYEFTDLFAGKGETLLERYAYFVDRVNRDNCIEAYCKENNIKFLKISYLDNNRLEEILSNFLNKGIDITTPLKPKILPIWIKHY